MTESPLTLVPFLGFLWLDAGNQETESGNRDADEQDRQKDEEAKVRHSLKQTQTNWNTLELPFMFWPAPKRPILSSKPLQHRSVHFGKAVNRFWIGDFIWGLPYQMREKCFKVVQCSVSLLFVRNFPCHWIYNHNSFFKHPVGGHPSLAGRLAKVWIYVRTEWWGLRETLVTDFSRKWTYFRHRGWHEKF